MPHPFSPNDINSTKRPRIKRRRGLKRSNAEKEELLRTIKSEFALGLSTKEIAAKHGISTASVYRWWRLWNEISASNNANASDFRIDINNVLDILSKGVFDDSIICRDAMFQFITWVRWPSSSSYHVTGLINCISSYLLQKSNSISIVNLDTRDADFLFKYLDLRILPRLVSPNAPMMPDYDIVTDARHRFDDLDFYAEITRYLISDPIPELGRAGIPNVTAAQFLASTGSFGRDWNMSARTFQKRWAERAASFPFLYVERFYPSLDWGLNPSLDSFSENIDILMDDPSAVQMYFSRCAWVIDTLRARLSSKVSKLVPFPKFSSHLTRVPSPAPLLPDTVRAKLNERKKLHKHL